MDIRERIHGSVVVLDVDGRLMAGDDGRLLDRISSLVFQGQRLILLNLAGTTHIDSIGLGELVDAHATVAGRDGRIGLVNLPAPIQDLLTVCGLLIVFDTFNTESDALRSLSAAAEALTPFGHPRGDGTR